MPFRDMRALPETAKITLEKWCVVRQRIMRSEALRGSTQWSSSEASKNANANSASNAPTGGPTDGQDLTVFVQSLLEQMQSRFAQMSDAIIGRNILFTNSLLHVLGR
ncbi:hypothetical protein F441_20850 [Phytophthora nicotianae CJ01A1]|uniref:Uncharacterized protein n=5 Tax=Phytophthora nicotianae TaxID=4792 RepID=V9E0Q6_PHYNI|nr:hypothetical protein F443_20984 [Phytophthora nicotianae P1569]ETO60874.1 hypothetical protein F444_20986 [Phytophthora nicotianae P1976]ETP01986.1 hypothetical protein F441_20850 [Phytophthora nicotianae CJ01A1]ETP30147.1 hypothetical protein F442_20790 [Phytophthora nicotianae P10297]